MAALFKSTRIRHEIYCKKVDRLISETNMKIVHIIAFILLVVGGLLWAVLALANWQIGSVVGPGVANIIYVLVGLAAVWEVVTHKKNCKMCEMSKNGQPM